MTRKLFCLAPKCGRPARTRHLCPRCYQSATAMVRGGVATWDELEGMGLCLPARPAEPKDDASPVAVALRARRAAGTEGATKE